MKKLKFLSSITAALLISACAFGLQSCGDDDPEPDPAPDATTDPDPDPEPDPETALSLDFISGVGSYYGSDSGVAIYYVDLSTNEYNDNATLPVSHLFVLLSGDAEQVNLKQLTIPVGTYTIGDLDNPAPGRFYAGYYDEDEQMPANSFLYNVKMDETYEALLVTGGTVTVSNPTGATYRVDVDLTLDSGERLVSSYEGSLIVDNYSTEVPVSDLLPLPDTQLTKDVTVTFSSTQEGYYVNYGTARFGIDTRTEYMLSLYTDDTYSDCVDIFLLVDNTQYGSLAVGTYPVIPEIDYTNVMSNALCAQPAYRVADSAGRQVDLGCWYTWGYSNKAPIASGQVEILSLSSDLKSVDIRFSLTDAAGHTVSGEYAGALSVITQ